MQNKLVILFLIFLFLSILISGQEFLDISNFRHYSTSKIAFESADINPKCFYLCSDTLINDINIIDKRRLFDIVKKIDALRSQLNILYKYAGSETVYIKQVLPNINDSIKKIVPNCPVDVLNNDLYNEDMIYWINEHPNEYLSVFKFLKKEIEKE